MKRQAATPHLPAGFAAASSAYSAKMKKDPEGALRGPDSYVEWSDLGTAQGFRVNTRAVRSTSARKASISAASVR